MGKKKGKKQEKPQAEATPSQPAPDPRPDAPEVSKKGSAGDEKPPSFEKGQGRGRGKGQSGVRPGSSGDAPRPGPAAQPYKPPVQQPQPGPPVQMPPGFQPPLQQSQPGPPVQMPPGLTPPVQQSQPGPPVQMPPGLPQQAPRRGAPGQMPRQLGPAGFMGPQPGPSVQMPPGFPQQAPRWGQPQQAVPVQIPPQQGPAVYPRPQQGLPAPTVAAQQRPPGIQRPGPQQAPPEMAKVTESMAKMTTHSGSGNGSHLSIPHRKKIGPVVGTKGRKILIEVNHLRLELKKTNAIAIHYDVSFQPDLPKKMLRFAMEAFRKKHFPRNYPAFDGRKNLYSCGKLPFNNEIRDTVSVRDEERQREKEFDITIKYASEVDMSALSTYTQTGKTLPQEAIQALDIVLRNPASLNFTPVGRSFFTPPVGQVIDLGDGMELWYGFYQSAILGWKPYLNIDVAHKGFPSAKYLVEVVLKIKGETHVDALSKPLDNWELQSLEKFIKGLKVEYQIPNQPNTRRTYKVNCLKGPSKTEKFKLENGSQMTVAEYFTKEKKINLRFSSMPCIHVGNEKKTIYLPLEFCKIAAGQVVNCKLNETQTAAMVKAAAKPADERKKRIMEAMRQANFNADKCIQEFGITVSQEFTKIDARILDPPKLEYSNNETVFPVKGVWRPAKFLKSNSLREWRILNLDQRTREDALWNFAQMMSKIGNRLGIEIAKPEDVRTISLGRGGGKQQIIDYFEKAKKTQLIVVVINDREQGIYGRVKQSAELNVGVLTQCIKSKTMFKMNDATCSNILLKVNSKLNGVNHQIDKSCRPKIFMRPIMIVGADVTHPSPDQKAIPSVAAVAASHDPTAFQYNMLWRLQPPRQEMIEDLEEMMKIQLKYFYKKTKHKPEKIIFYRDGVSEGQFSQVLDVELKAIRRACSAMDQNFKPPITFLVVQKRHHTRFFPTNPRDEDGRNKNVPAGTIVDTEITHPREMDFYLVSHASLQGTSRPTKYHKLWDDNDMDENDLEELTYYLCHLFSRCTRSVSYPAPTYYAHLAAFRARSYIEGAPLAMANLPNEQRQRTIQSSIVDDSPMFFV